MVKNFKIESDLKGVNIVVTGANSGIGRESAKAFYAAGASVWLCCRSEQKAKEAIDRIVTEVGPKDNLDPKAQLKFVALDLINKESIEECAKNLPAKIHILLNNAGFAGATTTATKDGLEPTFAVNHLGHFILTLLVLPNVEAGAKDWKKNARIVNVASRAHYFSKFSFDDVVGDTKSVIASYGNSKLANVLFTRELAKRLKEKKLPILTFSLHPGVVATDVWRSLPGFLQPVVKWFMLSEEQGSYTSNYCCVSADLEDGKLNGAYFDDCKEKETSKLGLDMDLAKTLWDKSVEWSKLPADKVTL